MASKRKKKAKEVASNVASNAADVANIANIAKGSPYIQRLIEDQALRDNVQRAIESGRSAYERIASSKAPQRTIVEDKKLQKDLRDAFEAARDAALAFGDAPKRQARKRLGGGRKLVVLGLGGGVALIGSESLRSKVLDALFGKEEEFEYTPPPAPAPAPTGSPVSAA